MPEALPSRALFGLAGVIESYGCSADELAEKMGVNHQALYRLDLHVDEVAFNDLLEEAAIVCKDRFIGLQLASRQSWRTLGPVWFLLRTATTVGQALQFIAAHLELYSEAISAYCVYSDTSLTFCYEVRRIGRPQRDSRVQVTELGLAVTCYELRQLLGDTWRPQHAQFRHGQPDNLTPLSRIFGDKLFFNQDVNAITLTLADAERATSWQTEVELPCLESDEVLFSNQQVPFALRVDRAIRLLISGQGCSAAKVADVMEMNLRTLQHQLTQADTSYQKIYDGVRFDMACDYLLISALSISDISERLYFSDTAAFSRFFRKRAGQSPRVFRRDR